MPSPRKTAILATGFAILAEGAGRATPDTIPSEVRSSENPGGDPVFVAADWLFAEDGAMRRGILSGIALASIQTFAAGSERCKQVGKQAGSLPLIEGETAITPFADLVDAVSRAEAILVGLVRSVRAGFTRSIPSTVFALEPEAQYGAALPRVDGHVLLSLPIGVVPITSEHSICKSDPGYPLAPGIGDRVVLFLSRSTSDGDLVLPMRAQEVVVLPRATGVPVVSPKSNWPGDERLESDDRLLSFIASHRRSDS